MPYVQRKDGVIVACYEARQSYAEEFVKPDDPEFVAYLCKGEWVEIRAKRDLLLAASDWTQLLDSPLTEDKRAEWVKYRQELREITNVKSPDDVKFPSEPEA